MSPTGYTQALCEGDQPFDAFVLQCARAFGALVTMRDDSMGAPIPEEFQPSDYHAKRLEELQARRARLSAMTEEQCQEQRNASIADLREQHYANRLRTQATLARLERMQARVEQWQPPTLDHLSLKAFMLQQLRDTIQYDGFPSDYYTDAIDRINEGNANEWRQRELDKVTKDTEYHVAEHAEEVERVAVRNRWLTALRQSLSEAANG